MDNPKVLYIGSDKEHRARAEFEKEHIPITFAPTATPGLEQLAYQWDLILLERKIPACEMIPPCADDEFKRLSVKEFPIDELSMYLLRRIREEGSLNRKTTVIGVINKPKHSLEAIEFRVSAKQRGVFLFYHFPGGMDIGAPPKDTYSQMAADISKLLQEK